MLPPLWIGLRIRENALVVKPGIGYLSRQYEKVLIEQSRNVLLTWLTLGSWKTKDNS